MDSFLELVEETWLSKDPVSMKTKIQDMRVGTRFRSASGRVFTITKHERNYTSVLSDNGEPEYFAHCASGEVVPKKVSHQWRASEDDELSPKFVKATNVLHEVTSALHGLYEEIPYCPPKLTEPQWTALVYRARGVRMNDISKVMSLTKEQIRALLFDAMYALGFDSGSVLHNPPRADNYMDNHYSPKCCPSNNYASFAVRHSCKTRGLPLIENLYPIPNKADPFGPDWIDE